MKRTAVNHNINTAIHSAQTVSLLRAVAANDAAARCNDYLAKHFLTASYKWLLRLVPHRLLKAFIHLRAPGSYPFIITRTRLFDQLLLQQIEAGVRQVVLLGAGYDTRPLRFASRLSGLSVFEVDFPGTQLYKRTRLRKTVAAGPHGITFIPVDLNRKSFDKVLLQHGFSPRLKTLFLWEGVSYYLPQSAVERVLEFVSSCAVGSAVVFDYATRDFVNGDQSTYGGKQVARWLKKIKEPFLFGMNKEETAAFLRSCHLTLAADYGPEDLERLYLTTTSGRLLGRTFGHVRMAYATVSNRAAACHYSIPASQSGLVLSVEQTVNAL